MTATAPAAPAPLAALLTPEAVRERCGELWALAEADGLAHFRLERRALDGAAEQVVAELRRNYPHGHVPFHSRWRHFELSGRDLWRELAAARGPDDVHARARSRFDLAIVSVLLDAGAGARWRYQDAASGITAGRSEGLALASLRLFGAGALSTAGERDPLRADATRLCALAPDDLARWMQSDAANPLPGLARRCELLRRLGDTVTARRTVFTRSGETRPGHLYDHLRGRAAAGRLPAREIVVALLVQLGDIWPAGRMLGGIRVGDVGVHPAVKRADESDGLVPFHKLTQWLAYSLIEPLEEAGIAVTEPDALTGLAEYRNGGLLVDCGVLSPRDESAFARTHAPGDTLVVEWRALTVAALDRIAARVRALLGLDAARLPLAAVLQGGTWSAGRRIAAERRAGGAPPLTVASDGTLF